MRGKYTKEFREEAVKLVTEDKLSWSEAAHWLFLPTSILANWVKAYKAGKQGGISKSYWPLTEVEMELAQVKRENDELKMERDILKKQPRTLRGSRYPVRDDARVAYSVHLMSRILSVSASGYYSWQDPSLSKQRREERRLELEIWVPHQRTRQTYGPERLQHDLAGYGVKVEIFRTKRIRKKLGLRCKQKRKFKVTTNSGHRLPVAENLLDQHFKFYEPDKVWLSDSILTTYPIFGDRLSHQWALNGSRSISVFNTS